MHARHGNGALRDFLVHVEATVLAMAIPTPRLKVKCIELNEVLGSALRVV